MQSRLMDEGERKLQMMRRLAALRAETRASLGVFSSDTRYFADPMLDPKDYGQRAYHVPQDIDARRERMRSSTHDQSSRSVSSERRMLISPAVSPGKPSNEQVWRDGTEFRPQRAIIIAPSFESSPVTVSRQASVSISIGEFDVVLPRKVFTADESSNEISQPCQKNAATQTPDVSIEKSAHVVELSKLCRTPDGQLNKQLEVVESPPPFLKAFQAALDQKSSDETSPAANSRAPVPIAPVNVVPFSLNTTDIHLNKLREQAHASMEQFVKLQSAGASSAVRSSSQKPKGLHVSDKKHASRKQDSRVGARCTFSQRLEIQRDASEQSKRAQENAVVRVLSTENKSPPRQKPPPHTLKHVRAPSQECYRAREPASRFLDFHAVEPPHPCPVKSIRASLQVGPRLDDQLRPIPAVTAKPTTQEIARAKAAAEAIRQERYNQMHVAEIKHQLRLRERDAHLERQKLERAKCEESLKQARSQLEISTCTDASPVFRVQL